MAMEPGQHGVHQEMTIALLVLPLLVGGFYVQPEVVLFSEHPQSLFVLYNSSFSLRCAVTLTVAVVEQLPTPQIVWDLDGKAAPGITTTNNLVSVLEINSAESGHTGWYRCLVIDGNDTSLCQVNSPCLPTITASQGAYVEVTGYSTLSKSVNISSVCTAIVIACLNYTHGLMERNFAVAWEREGLPVNTSSTQLLPSGDLILNPSDEMPGTYQCHTMSVSSEASITLSQVTVQLTANGSEPFLVVQLQPSSVVVTTEMAFKLVCAVEGSCDLSAVTWSKDGQTLDAGSGSGVEVESVAMVISSAKHYHGGQYCCSVGTKTSCANITIVEPANSTTHLINISSQDPTNLTLDCSPWPHANISPLWLHNGRVVSPGVQQLVVNITGTPFDSAMGIFQCFLDAHSSPALALHRVLPLGWPNPPGNLSYVPLPYKLSSEGCGDKAGIELSWYPPTYKGGLNEWSILYLLVVKGATSGQYELDNYTSAALELCNEIYHLSIAIANTDNQMISEESQPLTVSGGFCEIYSSQPPNVSLDCEQDGLSAVLEWGGLDGDITYDYSNIGTSVDVDCYNLYDNKKSPLSSTTYTQKKGSTSITSLNEGAICEFTGIDIRCDLPVSTTGSCTISSQSSSLSTTIISTTSSFFIIPTTSSTTLNTFFTFSTSTTTSFPESSPPISITPSYASITTPSPESSPPIAITPSSASTTPSSLESSPSTLTSPSPFTFPTLVAVVLAVSLLAGSLLLAFFISALVLIANHQHQRSKSRKDDAPWFEDSLYYTPVLAGVGQDTVSLHTVCEPLSNQEVLVTDPRLTIHPLFDHTSPMRGVPVVGVVGISRGGEEDGSDPIFPLRHDSVGDIVHSTSSSRKTSSDTSASSLGTDSGYIHCSTCTYTSLGNGEAHLDHRLEAIEEDLELCRLPHLTEEDLCPAEHETETRCSFQDVHCSMFTHSVEPDSTSDSEINFNPQSDIVISETPV